MQYITTYVLHTYIQSNSPTVQQSSPTTTCTCSCWTGYYKRPLYSCQSKLRLKSSCYKKLRYRENTARPSCLVGVLYDISRERFCWWLINYFYVIGHESYLIHYSDELQNVYIILQQIYFGNGMPNFVSIAW